MRQVNIMEVYLKAQSVVNDRTQVIVTGNPVSVLTLEPIVGETWL